MLSEIDELKIRKIGVLKIKYDGYTMILNCIEDTIKGIYLIEDPEECYKYYNEQMGWIRDMLLSIESIDINDKN